MCELSTSSAAFTLFQYGCVHVWNWSLVHDRSTINSARGQTLLFSCGVHEQDAPEMTATDTVRKLKIEK